MLVPGEEMVRTHEHVTCRKRQAHRGRFEARQMWWQRQCVRQRGPGGERVCGVLEVGKGLGKGTDQVQEVRLQMQAGTYPVMMSCEPW